MFLILRMLSSEDDPTKNKPKFKNAKSGLCGVPYAVLRQQAIDVQVKLNPQDQQPYDSAVVVPTSSHSMSMSITDNVAQQDANNNESMLWVEKFRPKNFIQLLSDDGTNRTLLRWLKLWDKVVFNKEIKRIKSQSINNESETKNDLTAKPSATEVIS